MQVVYRVPKYLPPLYCYPPHLLHNYFIIADKHRAQMTNVISMYFGNYLLNSLNILLIKVPGLIVYLIWIKDQFTAMQRGTKACQKSRGHHSIQPEVKFLLNSSCCLILVQKRVMWTWTWQSFVALSPLWVETFTPALCQPLTVHTQLVQTYINKKQHSKGFTCSFNKENCFFII